VAGEFWQFWKDRIKFVAILGARERSEFQGEEIQGYNIQ